MVRERLQFLKDQKKMYGRHLSPGEYKTRTKSLKLNMSYQLRTRKKNINGEEGGQREYSEFCRKLQ